MSSVCVCGGGVGVGVCVSVCVSLEKGKKERVIAKRNCVCDSKLDMLGPWTQLLWYLSGETGQKANFINHLNLVGAGTVLNKVPQGNIFGHSKSFHSSTYSLYLIFTYTTLKGDSCPEAPPYNGRLTLPFGMPLSHPQDFPPALGLRLALLAVSSQLSRTL